MLEILPGLGFGDVRFGMSPDEVRQLLGSNLTYEEWMGGNLNDSLYYPGVIISFDGCDAYGPLPTARVNYFRLAAHSGATLKAVPAFGPMTEELHALIHSLDPQAVWPTPGVSGYIESTPTGLSIFMEADGLVDLIEASPTTSRQTDRCG